MAQYLKNLAYETVFPLADQVNWAPGQVVSKTLAQNPAFGLTLFAIPKGEGISAHKSSGDAFVTILKGKCEATVGDKKFVLNEGDSIVMPAGIPHALSAPEDFKAFLVVAFPPAL